MLDINNSIQKLLKPPFIFIVIGVGVFAVIKAKSGSSEVTQDQSTGNYSTGVYSAEDVSYMQDATFNAVDQLNKLIDLNSENLLVLSEKLDTSMTNLNDLIRTTDAETKKEIADIKSGKTTNTTITPSTKNVKVPEYFTVQKWSSGNVKNSTLIGIGKQFGLSLNQVLDLNPQYKANPNKIKVGDKVRIK